MARPSAFAATRALGSLSPVLVPGWAAWGLLSMALWTNLMHGKVLFLFGGFSSLKKTLNPCGRPCCSQNLPYDCDVVSKQMISTLGEGQRRFLPAMFVSYFSSLFNVIDCSVL